MINTAFFSTFPAALIFGYLISLYASTLCEKPGIKIIFHNLKNFFILVILLEVICFGVSSFFNPTEAHYKRISRPQYFMRDEVLGYAPPKGAAQTAEKYWRKERLYDVTYTFDKNGLRVVPQFDSKPEDTGILFFGGSFTLGEGVNDSQAMPYLVGELSHYQAYNFGFHGYGPHQMLAALEFGLVKKIVPLDKAVVIVQTKPSYILRSAGLASWDTHGPNYVVGPDGKLKYMGHFDDHPNRLFEFIRTSYVYKAFIENRLRYSRQHLNSFIEIISASKKLAEKEFKSAEFHVLLWPDNDVNLYQTVLDELRKKNIHVHLITDILENYQKDQTYYEISHDGHPNALAHKKIAEYVVDEILNKKAK